MSTGLRGIAGVQATGSLLCAGQNASEGNYGAAAWNVIGALGSVSQLQFGVFRGGHAHPAHTERFQASRAVQARRPGAVTAERPAGRTAGSPSRRGGVRTLLAPAGAGGRRQADPHHHGRAPLYVAGRGWTQAGLLRVKANWRGRPRHHYRGHRDAPGICRRLQHAGRRVPYILRWRG